jgi:hypothetical protein
MRAIHLVRPSGSAFLEPLCGGWGSMDTHWTEDEAGVTCGACLDALRASSTRQDVRPLGGTRAAPVAKAGQAPVTG